MGPRYSLAVAGLLFAGSVLLPIPATGQVGDGVTLANNRILPAAFAVRDIRGITMFEKLMIVTRKALTPLAPADVIPLQAYDNRLACDDRLLHRSSLWLRGPRYGPAALVFADSASTREADAWYFPTPYDAISTARLMGWCDTRQVNGGQGDAGQRWYVATTYPIDEGAEGFSEPERRFMSIEADLVSDYVRELEQPESAATLALETTVWQSIRDDNDPAIFEEYLLWRPNSVFAQSARNQLEALQLQEEAK